MRYMLIAGEASGDLHASNLMHAIRAQDPEAEFCFMGGDLMEKIAGVAPLIHYKEVSFMGIIPVLRNLGKISRAGRRIQEAMLAFRPDVVIPVDFASFNFRYILPFAKRHFTTTPIIYYIAPKLWAWRPRRINTLKRYVDHLLCILPFEQEYFSSRQVPTTYVGNPCIDAVMSYKKQRAVQQRTDTEKPQITILPGSRKQEIKDNLKIMLEAVHSYASQVRIFVAGAPGLSAQDYEAYMADYPNTILVFGETYSLIEQSRLVIATSGTATLEIALLGTPLMVCYRMGGQCVARWIFKHFFSTPYISLPNLILGEEAIPELIGGEVNPQRLKQEIALLLADGERRSGQLNSLHKLSDMLGHNYSTEIAARNIVNTLRSR